MGNGAAGDKIVVQFNPSTNEAYMLKFINRILFGGTYKVVHICSTAGKRKIFWCDTWKDALEWASCALNCDKVTITNTAGFVLAQKG